VIIEAEEFGLGKRFGHEDGGSAEAASDIGSGLSGLEAQFNMDYVESRILCYPSMLGLLLKRSVVES
jgi:hypothetical protein